MNVLIFGATGMVGQGVLHECLLDPRVEHVVAIGRSPTGLSHPKVREILHSDFQDYSSIEAHLSGFDACFFCLGVSSFGMKADVYERVTYTLTMAAARVLARLNPAMTFVYVSGAGTDSSERGPIRWARVKGKTENALLRLPFKAACMFRPGLIQPMPGIRSKTWVYRLFYRVSRPLLPMLRRAFPRYVTTSQQVGRAMIAVAAEPGCAKPILENLDINALAPDRPQDAQT